MCLGLCHIVNVSHMCIRLCRIVIVPHVCLCHTIIVKRRSGWGCLIVNTLWLSVFCVSMLCLVFCESCLYCLCHSGLSKTSVVLYVSAHMLVISIDCMCMCVCVSVCVCVWLLYDLIMTQWFACCLFLQCAWLYYICCCWMLFDLILLILLFCLNICRIFIRMFCWDSVWLLFSVCSFLWLCNWMVFILLVICS